MLPKTVKTAIKRADKISAWLEAVHIAGFSEKEANGFFGKPPAELIKGLGVELRAPLDVRTDYTKRHTELLEQMK